MGNSKGIVISKEIRQSAAKNLNKNLRLKFNDYPKGVDNYLTNNCRSATIL